MPSLNTYKQLLGSKTSNKIKKSQSNTIMELTWGEDLQSCIGYIYDFYHDDEKNICTNLNSMQSKTKIPVEVKFIIESYNSLDKDQVGYKIQFKPSHENPLDYYKEYEKKYGIEYPLGLFIDLPNNKDIYSRWLICGEANAYDQFVTWYILPCDYLYQWVYTRNGIRQKYEMWGVSRNQNSYNSGVWRDYVIETVENQKKCLLPYNDITQALFYNQRMIISAPVEEGFEPITWRITKIENTNPKGIQRITFAQDKYDEIHDYIERDEDGYTIGMWADYYKEDIIPNENEETLETHEEIYNEITFNGIKPQIKIGGSYKTFTATFYDNKGDAQSSYLGAWYFLIDGENVDNLEDTPLEIVTSSEDNQLKVNQIKVKFIGNDDYLGRTLTVINKFNEIETKIDMAIIAL